MKRTTALGAIALFVGIVAQASAGAPLLDHLMTQVRAGSKTAPPEEMIQGGQCGVALGTTGRSEHHCRWDFPYRSPLAKAQFADLKSMIAQHLGAKVAPPEAGVNHPDSYDQVLFQLDDLQISLSLKDKAALRQSFVFLRVSPI